MLWSLADNQRVKYGIVLLKGLVGVLLIVFSLSWGEDHGQAQLSGGIVSEIGTVKFIELEGGFFGIIGDDGARYEPINLPGEFRMDGLRVRFVASILLGAYTIHMWGVPIQILVIEMLRGDLLLLAGRHYRVALPLDTFNIGTLIETAKQVGFSVRIANGMNVSYFLGTTPCAACTPGNEREFLRFPHLFVDGALFWLRAEGSLSEYNVRPAVSGGYEIIIAPKMTVSASPVVDEIGAKLAQLGVLREPTLPSNIEELTFVPGTKPPKPPEGVRLDSVLYGLMLMPDWYTFAPQARLELWGLRVRVIVELISADAQLAPTHNLIIEARSPSGLMRVLIPVHQLLALASDSAVKLVRPPFQPGL